MSATFGAEQETLGEARKRRALILAEAKDGDGGAALGKVKVRSRRGNSISRWGHNMTGDFISPMWSGLRCKRLMFLCCYVAFLAHLSSPLFIATRSVHRPPRATPGANPKQSSQPREEVLVRARVKAEEEARGRERVDQNAKAGAVALP